MLMAVAFTDLEGWWFVGPAEVVDKHHRGHIAHMRRATASECYQYALHQQRFPNADDTALIGV